MTDTRDNRFAEWMPRAVRTTAGTCFEVVTLSTEEGVAIACPGLPGCFSQGDTEAEALETIVDAIEQYLEVSAELQAAD